MFKGELNEDIERKEFDYLSKRKKWIWPVQRVRGPHWLKGFSPSWFQRSVIVTCWPLGSEESERKFSLIIKLLQTKDKRSIFLILLLLFHLHTRTFIYWSDLCIYNSMLKQILNTPKLPNLEFQLVFFWQVIWMICTSKQCGQKHIDE